MKGLLKSIDDYMTKENLPKIIALLIVSIIFVVGFMSYQRLGRLRSYIISYQGYISTDLQKASEDLTQLASALQTTEEAQTVAEKMSDASTQIQSSTVDMAPAAMYASSELLTEIIEETEKYLEETDASAQYAEDVKSLRSCAESIAENGEHFNESVHEYNYTLTQVPYNYAAKWLFRYTNAFYFSADGTETGTAYAVQ